MIAADLEFLTKVATSDVLHRTAEVTRLLHGLIRHYMRRDK